MRHQMKHKKGILEVHTVGVRRGTPDRNRISRLRRRIH